MKSIILAAGKGTRLGYLTKNKPKCMINVAGIPLLKYQIETLKSCNINNINIITGYLSSMVKFPNTKIYLNKDYATTNMVSTLFTAKEEINDESDVVISYGDIIYSREILAQLIKSDKPISIAIDTKWRDYWSQRMANPLDDAETLKIDRNGQLKEIGNIPKSYSDIEGQYMGLIKVKAKYFPLMYEEWIKMDKNIQYNGQNFENMYMTSFIQYLIDIGWNIFPVKVKNKWAEIDTKSDVVVAEKWLRSCRCKFLASLCK